MFIEINSTNTSPLMISEEIKMAREKSPNKVVSPEFAMEVLSKTNHMANIKMLVKNIKDKCVTKEQLEPYKEFIVSCVEGREVSSEIFDELQNMAKKLGCEEELSAAYKEPVRYNKYSGKYVKNETIVVHSIEEFMVLRGEKLSVRFDVDGVVDLSGCDLSKVKELKFREGADVWLADSSKLPENLDLSMCHRVGLYRCDLSNVKELKFKEGAEVSLFGSYKLPENLDVSMCDEVSLNEVDLSNVKELKFKEGAKVRIRASKGITENIDVSMCDEVVLSFCDLGTLKELKFKEGAKVSLFGSYKLPENIDVSMCDVVDLAFCDLEGSKLKFKEGAVVNLSRCKNLPKDLDLSMCSKVDLSGCDLSGVMSIKFANMAQKYEAMKMATNFEGKVVYAASKGGDMGASGYGGPEM